MSADTAPTMATHILPSTACPECDLLVAEPAPSGDHAAHCPRYGAHLYRHSRNVGTVTDIALVKDRRTVKVTVQMDKQAAPLLVEDSRFWVVRPRIAAGGVSGLNALLSGAYIALDPGRSDDARRSFIGLESPPLVAGDMPGRQFVLAADDLGSLDIGAPVYYRHIPVGRVVATEIAKRVAAFPRIDRTLTLCAPAMP